MSSFPYVWDANGTPKGDARFYMALFGQAITGVACPFVSSVPTKVVYKNMIELNCLIENKTFRNYLFDKIFSILQ